MSPEPLPNAPDNTDDASDDTMNCKAKGARAERKTIRLLEASGALCMKAGGSLGMFDVLALSPTGVRAIQVKSGIKAYCSPAEKEAIRLCPLPSNVSKEVWYWDDYARIPRIEYLNPEAS